MKPLVWIACALLCGPAAAQAPSPEVQRALLERQQQSEEFALQLRQSQSGLNARPEDRPGVDAFDLQQRQAQQQLHAEQQRQSIQDPEASRAGAEERFERERRAQDLRAGPPAARPDASLAPLRRCGPDERDGVVTWTPTLEPCRQ